MTKELLRKWKAAGMSVEVRQYRLQQNSEATERWQRKLFRAANELKKLADERKRLLKPRAPSDKKATDWTPDKYIGSGGGALNDSLEDI
jgi:hypothetical protein